MPVCLFFYHTDLEQILFILALFKLTFGQRSVDEDGGVKAFFYSCKFFTSYFLLILGHLSPRLWLFLCIFCSSV